MKLLIALSCYDLDSSPRRATTEAICHQLPDTSLLFFNGLRSSFVKRPSCRTLRYASYHSLTLGRLRQPFRPLDVRLKKILWDPFFRSFDTVFLTDPDQEMLLDHVGENQKLLYLIRDPNVLLSPANQWKERRILERRPHVFAVSQPLCTEYLRKYYGDIPTAQTTYWPNTADLRIWDYARVKNGRGPVSAGGAEIAGHIGNITWKSDLDLLSWLAGRHPDVQFELYGKLRLKGDELARAESILNMANVKYGGFVPLTSLPEIVARWSVGLVTERKDQEFAAYYDANKRYQYMAMGLPFVSYNYNAEDRKFGRAAFLANTREEYSEKLREALRSSRDPQLTEHCLSVARDNSSEKRAAQFIDAIR